MNASAPAEQVAALRQRGAHRHDPVHFHFIEALARRAAAQQGAARVVLDARLGSLLADYRRKYEAPGRDAGETAATPPCAPSGVPSSAPPCPPSPLAELLRHIAASATAHDESGAGDRDAGIHAGARGELKTLRNFRSTWSRLSVDLRLTPALAKVPDNAGPLNSHMLALRSLKLMRELSPEYLNRFMCYLDALLWLDRAGNEPAPAPKEAPRADGDKARKAVRKRAG